MPDPKIEIPAQPKPVGQVVFTVLSDGGVSAGIGGQVSLTALCTVLGLANAHLGAMIAKTMNQAPSIVMANGIFPPNI